MEKKSANYFLGLDIGTDSIGWAVTDEAYRIPKFNGNAMWGIRLFDGGNTAEERRLQRTARRRTQRKVQRIKLLQEIFSEEISKVDPGFFLRLSESKYHLEDRTLKQSNTLFNDENFDDKTYHKKFPTIYHLRHYLMNTKERVDLRLLYLAVHHIIKHRGHFLFDGETLEAVDDVESILSRLTEYLHEEMDTQFKVTDIETFKEIMSDTSLGINEKKNALEKTLEEKSSLTSPVVKLLAGGKVKVKDIFDMGAIEDESVSVQFGKSDSEEMMESLVQILPENFILIEYLKGIYDWGLLQQILAGEKSLSKAKVNIYDRHHEDLTLLKKMTKKYISEKYDEIFNDTETKGNYVSYVGTASSMARGPSAIPRVRRKN
jgi:CRISPR-associated endonuclease Csn1